MYIKQKKHKYFVLWLCLKISFPKLKAINVYLLKTKFVSVGIIKKGILNKKKITSCIKKKIIFTK